MPTTEQMQLALDFMQNLQGLRRDMRRNAQSYKDTVTAGLVSLTAVLDVMRQDADQYQTVRLGRYAQRLLSNAAVRTKLLAGMTAFGVALADLQSLYSELKTAADAFQTAATAAQTAADVNAAADALLAAVAAHDTVW